MSKRRIVFVGGGTGGHFYPLIAIAESIRMKNGAEGKDIKMYYMGPEPYDTQALDANGITFISCPAGKRRRYASIRNFFDPFKTLWGTFIALWKLFLLYPDVIMSKGGFTSVPVILAGTFLRIPIVIHESDAVPGSANRLARRFARYVAISYPEAGQFFKAEKTALTGIPIRHALLGGARADAHAMLGVEQGRPIILILGGSQGAERINELILKTLDDLLPTYSIVHQTGAGSFDITVASAEALIRDKELLSRYHPVPFLPQESLNQALHIADLIISRAGSGTIFEIGLHGKPSILIPIPGEISHDQRANAYAYARSGAASVIEEENLRDSLLVAEISRIMSSPETKRSMADSGLSFVPRDAGEKIAETLINIGEEHW